MPRSSERERNNQGTLSQIATCFSEVFQGADLVPSDIAAGLALLALQHRGVLEGKPLGWNVLEGSSFSVNETFPTNTEGRDVLNAGDNASKSLNPKGYGASTSTDGSVHQRTEAKGLSAPMSPEALSDMLAEAAHYARWALAAYGWMLYTWANPSGGLAMACSCQGLQECCCCCFSSGPVREGLGSSRQNIAARDSLDRAALKTCAGIRGEDLFYVSFTNGYASTLGTTVSG